MENDPKKEDVRAFKFPSWKRETILKFLVVFGMTGVGVAMMAAGFLAWVVGESSLLVTGVVAGAIFISAGGLGLLKCLEESVSR